MSSPPKDFAFSLANLANFTADQRTRDFELTVVKADSLVVLCVADTEQLESARKINDFVQGTEEEGNLLFKELKNPTLPGFENLMLEKLDLSAADEDGTIRTTFKVSKVATSFTLLYAKNGDRYATIHAVDLTGNRLRYDPTED
jgi:hypothetical protein